MTQRNIVEQSIRAVVPSSPSALAHLSLPHHTPGSRTLRQGHAEPEHAFCTSPEPQPLSPLLIPAPYSALIIYPQGVVGGTLLSTSSEIRGPRLHVLVPVMSDSLQPHGL